MQIQSMFFILNNSVLYCDHTRGHDHILSLRMFACSTVTSVATVIYGWSRSVY